MSLEPLVSGLSPWGRAAPELGTGCGVIAAPAACRVVVPGTSAGLLFASWAQGHSSQMFQQT